MAAFIFFDECIFNSLNGAIDYDTHTFKAALSNTAPTVATFDELADITEIANANGYTTGGVTLTSVTLAETGGGTGIWQWSCADFSWTASGGSIGTFQYVVIYSDTSTTDKLIGYYDYGGAVNITTGNTFTVDIGASGIFQAQEP